MRKKGFNMRRPCDKCEKYFKPATKLTRICEKCFKKGLKERLKKNKIIREMKKKEEK